MSQTKASRTPAAKLPNNKTKNHDGKMVKTSADTATGQFRSQGLQAKNRTTSKQMPSSSKTHIKEVITLSSDNESGSEQCGPGSPDHDDDRPLGDRVSDFQNGGPSSRCATFSLKILAKNSDHPASSESEGDSLSDGEIRDTPRSTKASKKPAASNISSSKKKEKEKESKTAPKKNEKGVKNKTMTPKNTSSTAATTVRTPAVDSTKPVRFTISTGLTLAPSSALNTPMAFNTDYAMDVMQPSSKAVNGTAEVDSHEDDENGTPLVQVTFLNSYIAKKYDSVFRKLTAGIIAREQKNLKDIRKAGTRDPVTIVYHEGFEEDANADLSGKPAEKPENEMYGIEDDSIPVLSSLSVDEKSNTAAAAPLPITPRLKQRECFNCGGTHRVDECTEKMDYAKINKKRQEFINSSPAPMGTNRYHEPTSDADRIGPDEFPDCIPGHISQELMDALGITRRELPPWIPFMRRCGFPPGYIRHCVVESSGLDFIDGEESGSGNVDPASTVTYDLSKLPVYPGFSAPHAREVAAGPIVKHYHDTPNECQQNQTVMRFLYHMVPSKSVVPRSPSPEAAEQDMEISSADEGEGDSHLLQTQESFDDEQKGAAAFCESIIPESPEPEVAAEGGSSGEMKSESELVERKPPKVVHSSSFPEGLRREERFEFEESSGFLGARASSSALLKTSSVPELGSFSGINILPSNDAFAKDMPPLLYEEAPPDSGRFRAIREELKHRKRKHSS